MAAANNTQAFDLINEILTNNNIQIAALVVAIVFGCAAAYGIYETIRFHKWERERQAHADDLEPANHAESHELAALQGHLEDDGAVVGSRHTLPGPSVTNDATSRGGIDNAENDNVIVSRSPGGRSTSPQSSQYSVIVTAGDDGDPRTSHGASLTSHVSSADGVHAVSDATPANSVSSRDELSDTATAFESPSYLHNVDGYIHGNLAFQGNFGGDVVTNTEALERRSDGDTENNTGDLHQANVESLDGSVGHDTTSVGLATAGGSG